jgi:colanic acid/amylovoran biosynthesis glycosyltransferase
MSGEGLKIAFIVRNFPALSETFILNQITGLLDLGHSVDIFRTIPFEQGRIHPAVEEYELLQRTRDIEKPVGTLKRILKGMRIFLPGLVRNPGLTLRALNVFKYGRKAGSLRYLYLTSGFTGKYDIVHCHYGMLGETGVLLRDLGARTGPVLTSFHGFDITTHIQSHGEDCYRNLFDRGDLFLPISENWKGRLIDLGCPPERIVVHRMAVDCGQFHHVPRSLSPGESVEVLSIARFVEKKGLEYAVKAVAALLKRGINLRYTIIGDGDLRSSLAELINELDVGDRIELAGWQPQDEVLSAMNSAHILLAPSVTALTGDQEGIPVVLMEAMAMGLPVISTLHSGIPELVENGVSGILVPPRDAEALENALCRLIENPGSWAAIGKAARDRVEKDYNIKKQVRRLERIYKDALEEYS